MYWGFLLRSRLFLKISNHQASSFGQFHPWLPMQKQPRLGNVETDIVNLSGSPGYILRLNVLAEELADGLKHLKIRGWHTAADVENFVGAMLQRRYICGDYVGNIDVVSQFPAVPVNYR